MTTSLLSQANGPLLDEHHEPPRRHAPRLHPYFLEQGESAVLGHDFLLQNPRPDLTETEPWACAEERRMRALDLP